MPPSVKTALQKMYDRGENTEIVLELLHGFVKPRMHILDIGPGTGRLIHYLEKFSEEGKLGLRLAVMDYLQSVLDEFGPEVEKHLFNLQDLADTSTELRRMPLPDSSYDVVLFTEVIEHITFPQILLSEVARILRNGGYLFITTPNIFCLGNRLATLIGTDKLFRRVGEEGFISTIEFHRFGHVAHYSPKSLQQAVSPWFSIIERTGSGFKIPGVRFFQKNLAKLLPNLANHVILVAQKKDLPRSGLNIVHCILTGGTELVLPDDRCLHPVPHNKICYSCPHFHKDFLHPRDPRKKAGYTPK